MHLASHLLRMQAGWGCNGPQVASELGQGDGGALTVPAEHLTWQTRFSLTTRAPSFLWSGL